MADDATLEQQNTSVPTDSAPSSPSPAPSTPDNGGGGAVGGEVQTQPSFLEQVSEFGDDFKGLTDEAEARNRLLEHARAVRKEREDLIAWQKQANPYVQYGQRYAQLVRNPAFQQFLAAQQAPQHQQHVPQQPQQPKHWWAPPQFDRNSATKWIQRLVDPQTQEVVTRWKDDTPPEVRQAYEAYRAYEEDWQDRLTTRPHEVLPDIIRHEVAPLIEQVLAERDRQANARMFASDVIARNSEWLYQKDGNGQPLVDPVTNEPVFTEAGQKVAQTCKWLESQGMRGPELAKTRWFIATNMLYGEALAQSQAQTPQPSAQDLAAKTKADALAAGRGANHIPQRNGSRISPEVNGAPRQNSRISAGRDFVNALKREGVPLSSIYESQVS